MICKLYWPVLLLFFHDIENITIFDFMLMIDRIPHQNSSVNVSWDKIYVLSFLPLSKKSDIKLGLNSYTW